MPRITQKGQVTIPREIRNKFSLLPGSDVEFIVRGNDVVLVKSRKENAFMKWIGRGGRRTKKAVDMIIDDVRGRSDE